MSAFKDPNLQPTESNRLARNTIKYEQADDSIQGTVYMQNSNTTAMEKSPLGPMIRQDPIVNGYLEESDFQMEGGQNSQRRYETTIYESMKRLFSFRSLMR